MPFEIGDVSQDDFLGGRLRIFQPRTGYRAGVDPVLLAASVPAQPGQSVLELGCGAGVAALCLGHRIQDLKLFGVELQAEYCELASANAKVNDLPFSVFQADIRNLPADIRELQFDHVIANPPYFRAGSGTPAQDAGRNTAHIAEIDLSDWVTVASRRLRPGGNLTIIQRANRLQDVLNAIGPGIKSLIIRPVAPRVERPAELVIVHGRKGGRAELRIMPPIILHQGLNHKSDQETYTADIRDVLRNGAALPYAD